MLRINVEKTQEKREEKEQAGRKYHRWERSSTFVGRALRMPDAADLDKASALASCGMPWWTCLTSQLGSEPSTVKDTTYPTVPLPPPFCLGMQIKAKYENGTLTLDIPKKPEAVKEAKRITVG